MTFSNPPSSASLSDPRSVALSREALGEEPSGKNPSHETLPGEVGRYVDELTRHLRQALEQRLTTYAERGHAPSAIGSAEEIARRMLDIVPKPSPWNELIGPFYGTRQVTEFLGGISRQALNDRRHRRTVLALKTTDGVLVYPAFQFEEGNKVLDGLGEILQSFPENGADDWEVAGWLVSPLSSLGGKSMVSWLREGGDRVLALAVARDAARRLRQ